MRGEELTFAKDGAQLFSSALSIPEVRELQSTLESQPQDQAGLRLSGVPQLRSFLTPNGPIGRIPASVLGLECLPVRAIFFDKSAKRNWSLGWHQDRTIAVKRRIDVAGFGPWSIKSGMVHVEPPFALLASMVTVRVHIDSVPITNAPLLIAPGSHKCGCITTSNVPDFVRQHGVVSCLAEAGDLWLYSTPILHASDAAVHPRHRRVLQVDYASCSLPGGLEWVGV